MLHRYALVVACLAAPTLARAQPSIQTVELPAPQVQDHRRMEERASHSALPPSHTVEVTPPSSFSPALEMSWTQAARHFEMLRLQNEIHQRLLAVVVALNASPTGDARTPPVSPVAVDGRGVDDTELLQWTEKAVLASYSVNYHDYPEQMKTAGRRFTASGWRGLSDEFNKIDNLGTIKRLRMLCHTQTQRAASIREIKVVGGSLAYDIQVPILRTCENIQQQITTSLMVTTLVVRTGSREFPDGFAIEQFTAEAQ